MIKVIKLMLGNKNALSSNKSRDQMMIEQKGIPFDHDFGYSLPIFTSLLKKIGIKNHAFLLDPK